MCGCSPFDRDWKSAVDTWKVTDATDITGPWEGTWQSEVGSHSGALRCLITKTGDYEYHARFAATYWKIFHFGYDVNLSAEPHLACTSPAPPTWGKWPAASTTTTATPTAPISKARITPTTTTARST